MKQAKSTAPVSRVNARQAGRSVLAAAAVALLATCATPLVATGGIGVTAAFAQTTANRSQAAYEEGRRAFVRGAYNEAVDPLRLAADGGVLLAHYYLAEILSDPRTAAHDPDEAFRRYVRVIEDAPDVDPDYDYRARFVGRAYVMAGRYYLGELRAPSVRRSPVQARRLFGYAANYLDFADAQYEFARMLMKGRGGRQNVQSGKHYLSTLSRKGHAGAQGYLAELFFTGTHVPKRRDYALALSTLAVKNAPSNDALWINALHNDIQCSVTGEERNGADALIARWSKGGAASRVHPRDRGGLLAGGSASWSCDLSDQIAAANDAPGAASDVTSEDSAARSMPAGESQPMGAGETRPASGSGIMRGSVFGPRSYLRALEDDDGAYELDIER
ncbi:MAG: tetratricopeptide repeat protein [Pseudomonadota bacterium]